MRFSSDCSSHDGLNLLSVNIRRFKGSVAPRFRMFFRVWQKKLMHCFKVFRDVPCHGHGSPDNDLFIPEVESDGDYRNIRTADNVVEAGLPLCSCCEEMATEASRTLLWKILVIIFV